MLVLKLIKSDNRYCYCFYLYLSFLFSWCTSWWWCPFFTPFNSVTTEHFSDRQMPCLGCGLISMLFVLERSVKGRKYQPGAPAYWDGINALSVMFFFPVLADANLKYAGRLNAYQGEVGWLRLQVAIGRFLQLPGACVEHMTCVDNLHTSNLEVGLFSFFNFLFAVLSKEMFTSFLKTICFSLKKSSISTSPCLYFSDYHFTDEIIHLKSSHFTCFK